MSLFRRLAFNLWYYREPPWDTGVSPPELLEFIHNNDPGRALDLGCGTGTNVLSLVENGWQATGVDFAAKAIKAAQKKAKEAKLQANFITADVTQLNLPESYNLILDMGCFHGLRSNDRRKYIENVRKWLSPDGTLLLYAIIKSNQSANAIGINEEELNELFGFLKLVTRKNGEDRGKRRSVWLTLTHK